MQSPFSAKALQTDKHTLPPGNRHPENRVSIDVDEYEHLKSSASKLSISIGTFLTNYDVTNRKFKYDLTYSIVGKWTKREINNPMETTVTDRVTVV